MDVHRYRRSLELLEDQTVVVPWSGTVEDLWATISQHELVRVSNRRGPRPAPPRGAPLLASRDGDRICVRYWRPRWAREAWRLELAPSPSEGGHADVRVTLRTRGLRPRWSVHPLDMAQGLLAGIVALALLPLLLLLLLLWFWKRGLLALWPTDRRHRGSWLWSMVAGGDPVMAPRQLVGGFLESIGLQLADLSVIPAPKVEARESRSLDPT